MSMMNTAKLCTEQRKITLNIIALKNAQALGCMQALEARQMETSLDGMPRGSRYDRLIEELTLQRRMSDAVQDILADLDWMIEKCEEDERDDMPEATPVSTDCLALIEAHRWALDVACDAINNTDCKHMMFDPDIPDSVREDAIEKMDEALFALLGYRPCTIAELARVSSYLSDLYSKEKYGEEHMKEILKALATGARRLAA